MHTLNAISHNHYKSYLQRIFSDMQNIHKKIRMQNAIYTLIQILSFTQNDTILNYKKMLT